MSFLKISLGLPMKCNSKSNDNSNRLNCLW